MTYTGEPHLITVSKEPSSATYTHPDLISKTRSISWVEDEPSGAFVSAQLSQALPGPSLPADWVDPPSPPHREFRPINRVRNLVRKMNRHKI